MRQILFLFIFFCTLLSSAQQTSTITNGPVQKTAPQISEYIRRIFQDRSGNLWFGTNSDGVARYNGKSLEYFLWGCAVREIIEDEEGNIWFATNRGIARYSPAAEKIGGKWFTVFTTQDGLIDNNVWTICKDQKGKLWVGTESGVNCFDARLHDSVGKGKKFTSFTIPVPQARSFPTGVQNPKMIWKILKDKNGFLWFATYGGVYRYDGTSLKNFTKADGLKSDFVYTILEDKKGELWFGTQEGISRYNGQSFSEFKIRHPVENSRSSCLLEEKNGHLWFAIINNAICRYDPSDIASAKPFTCFSGAEGLTQHKFVQSVFEDKKGILWFGCSGGLYRYDKKTFVNVTKEGPWP